MTQLSPSRYPGWSWPPFSGYATSGSAPISCRWPGLPLPLASLVDATIVVTNAFRCIEQRRVDLRDRRAVMATVRDATHLIGRPIFFPWPLSFWPFFPSLR